MADAPHRGDENEQDASMDTILASIRRIIMEDEAVLAPPAQPHAGHDDNDDDVLVLHPSMIVGKDATTPEPAGRPPVVPQTAAELAAALFDEHEPVIHAPPPAPAPMPVVVPVGAVRPVVALPAPEPVPAPMPEPAPAPPPAPPEQESLLAPSASLAAAQALASLQDAIRPVPPAPSGVRVLRSGGPTLEDLVRDELRGQLKHWLDTNLPPLVERLVAQEIGRLVGRS